MKLFELLSGIEYKTNEEITNLSIDRIVSNSNMNCKNAIFVCLKGTNTDGHSFVNEAKQNGAVAVVVEKKVKCDLPQIIVNNSHKVISLLAKKFYGSKCDKIHFIGITGTNGKTTTSYIIKSMLESAGNSVGVIGTLGAFYSGINIDCNLTTPDPCELHRIIEQMYDDGVEYVVMEVSAHAIDQFKVWGIKFDVGVFTNLTQDHLDYFQTMDRYSKIKESFFTNEYIKIGVVNADDSLGQKMLSKQKTTLISYGMKNPSDIFAIDCITKLSGTIFALNMFDNYMEVSTKLVGIYNVYNIMSAATAVSLLGVNFENIKRGIENCVNVDGRFNVYQLNGHYVVIDFAHTPDGLKNILSTVRKVCDGRIISIFGCGGNRDNDKRKLMGIEAEKYSSFSIITSDNPRYENPDLIIKDIEQGFHGDNYISEVDRKKAIQIGMSLCREGDCLVICGKGGEKYQDINGVKVPYSDVEEVFKYAKKEK